MSKKLVITLVCLVSLWLAGNTAQADLTYSTDTTSRSGWTIVSFTLGSGTWTVPTGVLSLEVLVVGGGGSGAAGGTWNANGGGAGGFYNTTSYSVTPGSSLTLVVGTGGAALSAYGAGNNGGYSQFDQIIAYGGQGGPYGSSSNPGGASGGYSTNNGGTIIPGIAGASGGGSSGGSGAGAAGVSNWGPSYGGNGLQSAITGTSIYYAGGGGGGYSGDNNAGGLGGGGKGASELPGDTGFGHNATFYGGGGGASRDNSISGAGYGGVVIVAFQPAAIPEPGTWALVGLAMIPLFFRRSRKS